METIAEIEVDPRTARVHEHGWQSWTPASTARVDRPPHRAADPNVLRLHNRDGALPADAFQADGLLAVEPAPGADVHVLAAPDGRLRVPTMRARLVDHRVIVEADGPVDHVVDRGPGGVQGALARWADGVVERLRLPAVRPAPTIWCSWYHYFTEVSESDMDENLAAIAELDLPVDVVQLDDGYQAEIGDWLELSDRFRSLDAMVARIRDHGRRAGLWLAPFLVGASSRVATEHPDWLVGGEDGPITAGHHWGQRLGVLDVSHPAAAAHLAEVFATQRAAGFDFFKIDFVYAGALPGRRHAEENPLAAYREGLRVIRDAIGDAYLLGCGAPLLPSLGLVDAMRVSPDTDPRHDPFDGELSLPGSRAAMLSGRERAFQHGRFWVNDPDCLIVRPAVERREEWAAHVERFGGLRGSSDRIADLDDWGLQTTRRLLGATVPETFVG
jgi:alpha-galactosidase